MSASGKGVHGGSLGRTNSRATIENTQATNHSNARFARERSRALITSRYT